MPGDGSRKVEASRKHFDSWSRTYEHDRASRRLNEIQHEVIASLALRPDDRLLDVGCGTGAAVREAAPQVKRGVGIDLSPGMLTRARELASGLDNVEFREVDVSGPLPFADGQFTAVMSTTAFHHFPKPEHAVREMARVLAPGGRLVIADANADMVVVRVLDFLLRRFQASHVGFPRPSRVAAMMTASGLEEPAVTTLWKGGYALVQAEAPAT
jgi:ubiquinone/menaquinone biosynthesis C-methylase UbiE